MNSYSLEIGNEKEKKNSPLHPECIWLWQLDVYELVWCSQPPFVLLLHRNNVTENPCQMRHISDHDEVRQKQGLSVSQNIIFPHSARDHYPGVQSGDCNFFTYVNVRRSLIRPPHRDDRLRYPFTELPPLADNSNPE